MITKVFKSGNSQAVRIPKELQIKDDEVEIIKRGEELIIRPLKNQTAAILFDLLSSFEGKIERPSVRFQERDF